MGKECRVLGTGAEPSPAPPVAPDLTRARPSAAEIPRCAAAGMRECGKWVVIPAHSVHTQSVREAGAISPHPAGISSVCTYSQRTPSKRDCFRQLYVCVM